MHEIFMQLQVMGSLLVVKIFECLNIGKTLINLITIICLIEDTSLIEDTPQLQPSFPCNKL